MSIADKARRIDAGLSIVMPAHDEEEVIARTVLECQSAVLSRLNSGEIICIDDASSDRTPAVLARLCEEVPQLRVHRNETNLGHGPSLLEGLSRASGDLVFWLDSDYQMKPGDFWMLYERFDGNSMIIGSRRSRQDSMPRRLASSVANRLICAAYGMHRCDLNVPFKLAPAPVMKRLLPVIPRRAAIPSTLLVIAAHRFGIPVLEVPVPHSARSTGRNWLTAARFLRFSLAVMRELIQFERRLPPRRR